MLAGDARLDQRFPKVSALVYLLYKVLAESTERMWTNLCNELRELSVGVCWQLFHHSRSIKSRGIRATQSRCNRIRRGCGFTTAAACSISSTGGRHHFRMTLRTALNTAFACGSVAPPSSSAAVRTWALAGPSRRVANASRKRSFTAGCACECGRESHVTDSRAARARARKCQHRDSGRTFEEQLSSSSSARLSVSEMCTVAMLM